ncbi:MAG: hypothetical protein LBP53_00535 [Candidatus Peribacteria bacterium]|nr:hypothetical protein [Candidatus Peribacteria bacterium]
MVSLITGVAYVICTMSLFTSNSFLIPFLSFIVLFIALYFFAIEWYHRNTKLVRLILLGLFI